MCHGTCCIGPEKCCRRNLIIAKLSEIVGIYSPSASCPAPGLAMARFLGLTFVGSILYIFTQTRQRKIGNKNVWFYAKVNPHRQRLQALQNRAPPVFLLRTHSGKKKRQGQTLFQRPAKSRKSRVSEFRNFKIKSLTECVMTRFISAPSVAWHISFLVPVGFHRHPIIAKNIEIITNSSHIAFWQAAGSAMARFLVL